MRKGEVQDAKVFFEKLLGSERSSNTISTSNYIDLFGFDTNTF